MKLEIDIPEHQYNNIMAIDSMSLGRAQYKGIIMYAINAIKRGKVLEQEPTTKNCESCRYYGLHHEVCNYCYECSLWTEGEPTAKDDLTVDLISRADVIRAIEDVLQSDNCDYDLIEFLADLKDIPSVTPQEPKPMVEIDFYSVIKQKYIEREVLDKIRAEIEELYSYVEFDEDIKTSYNMVRLEEVQRVIDKYKAESEET